MKFNQIITSLLISLLATATLAGGTHAGGHDDEAIGKPGVAGKVTRTVTIDMRDDMKFRTDMVEAKQGETIRFIAKNSGKIKHEMVLGTENDLKDHNELMKKNPGMEHEDANMVTVAPGKSGEIIWQFTKAGKINFACLQPGHFDAGMKGYVNVASNQASTKNSSHKKHVH
jgi:uncharacterized cupredoxin-like copper-binding protein